jgi:hypothetical protein
MTARIQLSEGGTRRPLFGTPRSTRRPHTKLLRRGWYPGFFSQGRIRVLLVKIRCGLGSRLSLDGELALRDVIVRPLVDPSLHEFLLHFGRDGWIRLWFVGTVAAAECDGPGQQ